MAAIISRSRSNTSGSPTSSRPKPISRASTTSINTDVAQLQQYSQAHEASHLPSKYPIHHQAMRYTPEEMITHPEQQSMNPNQQYAIDPSLQNHHVQQRAMSVDQAFGGLHGLPGPRHNHFHSFDGKDVHLLTNINDEQTPEDSGAGDGQKKKGSASSIANDQELKRLFKENKHRDLADVAASVLANERGPKSEKTKQIFAMNWLATVCQKGKTSVPRNRVFSHYARRCGNERVPPLNPASFGKLVRIIFPGIQTRRLGMRGESKYHYVDLSLKDDVVGTPSYEGVQLLGDVGGATQQLPPRRPSSQLPADTAVFPSPSIPLHTNLDHSTTNRSQPSTSLYSASGMPNIYRGPAGPAVVRRELDFPTFNAASEEANPNQKPFELPSIQPYLPPGTDLDAANALVALYRSHCISVVDSFRFCKERMFWHHFSSFHGTLTVPVQKLLAHPDIAAWIEECDWLMYQKMTRFVERLALQVVPVKGIDTFRAISVKLESHISAIFQNHPQHVRNARVAPATLFAGLLDRLLRVNSAAHAAANILSNDANRAQMWYDWVCYVQPNKVVETCIFAKGHTRTMRILGIEMCGLLGQSRETTYPEMLPLFHLASKETKTRLDFSPTSPACKDDNSTEGVLDRWVNFLHWLPSRFPEAGPSELLYMINLVSTAALRDITMAQAVSFGSWWVTKVWVDEMMYWLTEKAGFLERAPAGLKTTTLRKRSAGDAGLIHAPHAEDHGGSRPRTGTSGDGDDSNHYDNAYATNGYHHNDGRLDPQLQHRSYQQMTGSQSSHYYQSATYLNEQRHDQDNSYYHQSNTHNTAYDQEYRQPTTARYQKHDEKRPDVQGNGYHQPRTANMSGAVSAHVAREADLEQGHDDSGIGLDLDLPQHTPSRLANYEGFIANETTNQASDPADVVVC